MKIVHFGDIHLWDLTFPFYDPFYFKRYLGLGNLLLNRRKKFPREVGQKVVEHILAEDADLVVFSGDMTTAALKSEFAAAAQLFEPLYEKWGDRFFVIPGNHDRYTAKSTTQDWFAKAFPQAKIDVVRALELDEHTVVVGFDASEPFLLRSNGYFSSRTGECLDEMLGRYLEHRVILVGHYPVEYPDSVEIEGHHELIHRSDLGSLIKKHNPDLYLHGHKHIRWRIGKAVNSGSAGMVSDDPLKQAGYAVITMDGKEIASVEACHLGKGGEMKREVFTENF